MSSSRCFLVSYNTNNQTQAQYNLYGCSIMSGEYMKKNTSWQQICPELKNMHLWQLPAEDNILARNNCSPDSPVLLIQVLSTRPLGWGKCFLSINRHQCPRPTYLPSVGHLLCLGEKKKKVQVRVIGVILCRGT